MTEPFVHAYLSTACLHAIQDHRQDLHTYCQTNATTHDGSEKVAAQCKWCEAKCICPCHESSPSRSVVSGDPASPPSG